MIKALLVYCILMEVVHNMYLEQFVELKKLEEPLKSAWFKTPSHALLTLGLCIYIIFAGVLSIVGLLSLQVPAIVFVVWFALNASVKNRPLWYSHFDCVVSLGILIWWLVSIG